MGRRIVAIGCLLGATGWLVGCSDDSSSQPAAERLQRALDRADPGDRVRVGPGTVTGSFRVPAGVILEGSQEEESFLVAPAGQPALVLEPGPEGQATAVHHVTVVSDGGFGVASQSTTGGGTVLLEDVEVLVQLGLGIGLEGLAQATLTRVHIQGPISLDNPNGPNEPTPDNSATHGIVLIRVADAQLTDVQANGFAAFGALFVESNTTWDGGGASENMGTGTMVEGGTADFQALRLCNGLQGVRLLPAFGAVFAGNADVSSSSLTTCDTEGLGLFHAAATGRHTDLAATGNEDAAIWIQDSPSFEMRGAATMVADNGLAGVVALDSSALVLTGGVIAQTRLKPRVLAEAGLIEVGDGVQLVGTTDDVVMQDVTLAQNERVGLLLDLAGGTTTGVTLDQVTVDGAGDQLGAIGQNGELLPGWDEGVMRLGDTAVNDESLGDLLDVVRAVSPTDYPTAGDVATEGLERFGAVSPTD